MEAGHGVEFLGLNINVHKIDVPVAHILRQDVIKGSALNLNDLGFLFHFGVVDLRAMSYNMTTGTPIAGLANFHLHGFSSVEDTVAHDSARAISPVSVVIRWVWLHTHPFPSEAVVKKESIAITEVMIGPHIYIETLLLMTVEVHVQEPVLVHLPKEVVVDRVINHSLTLLFQPELALRNHFGILWIKPSRVLVVICNRAGPPLCQALSSTVSSR
mmetsp:Transcript_25523/g.46152  ORF Transcript_25523/g.46152 Transcript_25523/m.46152 type:complete len:215 (-) Transcript_25523:494-1138(-)